MLSDKIIKNDEQGTGSEQNKGENSEKAEQKLDVARDSCEFIRLSE